MGPVIRTIKQNCRRCYSCVRDCPAKAIRIVDGQAKVVAERCIACGSCTIVCSQQAKEYEDGTAPTRALLAGPAPVAALLAPSYPAAFPEIAPARLVGALRAGGFAHVIEVAYGADLVAEAYRRYLADRPQGLRIATACPAVVDFVRKYNPALVPNLIPIVSPMVATALAARRVHGAALRTVFIGPCIAKKQEARDPALPDAVDAVLTFDETRRLLAAAGVDLAAAAPAEPDAPRAGSGRLFPFVGGLLRSVGLERSPLDPEIVVLSGAAEAVEVLGSLTPDETPAMLVEALMCRGCYCGPGATSGGTRLARKRRVSEAVSAMGLGDAPAADGAAARAAVAEMAGALPLGRGFTADDQRLAVPTEEELRGLLARTNKFSRQDELNCGACGYHTCREKAIAVHRGLAEEAMCLPFMIEQAERVCHELKVPWRELRDLHRHVINTEKLASMGQMAAGVAHELNNPLGSILLYTAILGRKLKDRADLGHDLAVLVDEAGRCKRIIGSLLDFARQSRVHLEPVGVAELLQRAAEDATFAAPGGATVSLAVDADPALTVDLDRDQMTQVLINLIKNALEAMEGRPGTVRLAAEARPETRRVRITVTDEGRGIPPEARDRVFQPFFTTKSIGKGTGLGLPIAYGIVKMHHGSIWFESEVDRGTTFIIELPQTPALGLKEERA